MKKITFWAMSLFFIISAVPGAFAEDAAKPTQLGLHEPASSQMERISYFHNDLLMWVITIIVIFVTLLLAWVIIRYNKKSNPTPSKTTHHVMLEVLWTVLPVVILIVIAVPSFKMLYYLDRVEEPEMTLKVIGHQWYWEYEYQNGEGITFSSYMVPDADIDESKGQRRLLSTDNQVVLPINTNIQIIITSADVLHSFTVPAFGFKKDAVPGRLNETWVNISKPGIYFGQCSEICGKDHAFMPIEVKAVTKEEFQQWLIEAKEKFAALGNRPFEIAAIKGVQ